MKFQLKPYHRDISDEDLIQDVRDVAKSTGSGTLTIRDYERLGKYHPSTLQNRFRSWFVVLEKAGLRESRSKFNIPDVELFDNMKDVWIFLGRQPKRPEIKKPLSKFGATTYERRFGSWQKALQAFVAHMNVDRAEEEQEVIETSEPAGEADGRKLRRRTRRQISQRLRFSILLRDGFCCQSCGRSPLHSPGLELEVDHIVPWSQGGETDANNLQTKCKQCNQGKGNAFDK